MNSRYKFDLLHDSKAKEKTIFTNVVPSQPTQTPLLTFLTFPFANFFPLGRSYLDTARGPGTTVTAYDDFTWDGRPAKRLELTAAYVSRFTRTEETSRFAFYFRPDLRWVCVGMEWFDGEKPLKREIYRYGPPAGGCPVPVTYESYSYANGPSGPGGKLMTRDTFTSFVKSPVPFPESEFTLSHFGFPEPENVAPATAAPPLPIDDDVLAPPRPVVIPARPWWHWVALAVAVFGVAGLIARVVRRNRK